MKKYYVLHERDFMGEGIKVNSHQRELYDRIKKFSDINVATNFALSKLNEAPILFSEGVGFDDEKRIKNPSTSYVIAAYFEGKYTHYCYDGSSDSVPTHEIERTSLTELEGKLENISRELPDKIYFGIELKLFQMGG